MIRRLMRRKDLYKHFNEFFFGSFWVWTQGLILAK
jgi:hypothetical protein